MELRSGGDAKGVDGALASLIVCGECKRMKMWRWLLAAVALMVVLVVAAQLSDQERFITASSLGSVCNGCRNPIPDSAGCRSWCGPI